MNKKILSAKFYILLREASQKGTDIDVRELQNSYDEFILLLLSKSTPCKGKDRETYRSTLAYINAQLALMKQTQKKRICVKMY
jgi:hypothetical protein